MEFKMCQASISVNDVKGVILVGVVIEIWKQRNFVIFNRGVTYMSEVFVLTQVKV